MVSMYDIVLGIIAISLIAEFIFGVVQLGFIATEDSLEPRRFVAGATSFGLVLIFLSVLLIGSDRESISLLVDRVEITSVSYKPGDREISFVRDGKIFQLASSKCRFIVVNKNQISDHALPYYYQEQEDSRDVITIFGHKFYDDPQIETKYTFYVAEDFLENLDYEIEHTILVDG